MKWTLRQIWWCILSETDWLVWLVKDTHKYLIQMYQAGISICILYLCRKGVASRSSYGDKLNATWIISHDIVKEYTLKICVVS